MISATTMATEMFTLAIVAMVVFLLVWCVLETARMRRVGFQSWSRGGGRENEARGLALLSAWLSPEQLNSYRRHAYFDVTGSHSGDIYRIRYGAQANVEQLDAKGRSICAWCFLPAGDLVAGDVMLAQKITLETNERAAMAVARKHPIVRGSWRRVFRAYI